MKVTVGFVGFVAAYIRFQDSCLLFAKTLGIDLFVPLNYYGVQDLIGLYQCENGPTWRAEC